MGRVASRVMQQIEEVAAKVAEQHEAGGGDAACQTIVTPLIQNLYERVESGSMSQSTLLKGVLPALWKEVGAALDTTPSDARLRLFTFDRATGNPMELRRDLGAMRSREKGADEKAVQSKHEALIEWDRSIYEALLERATSWLHPTEGETENDRIVKLIFAVSFFTGRRPWSEVANVGEFEVVTEPKEWEWVIDESTDAEYLTNFEVQTVPIEFHDWADGWLRMRGAAKPSYKEKVRGESLPVDFPVLGIDPLAIVEAMAELRKLEAGKSWFRATGSADKEIIGSVLQGVASKLIQTEIEPIFEPIYERGHKLPGTKTGRFTVYHLRSLYASRLHAEIRQVQREEGMVGMSNVRFAKAFLGHRAKTFGAASLNYTVWEYVD